MIAQYYQLIRLGFEVRIMKTVLPCHFSSPTDRRKIHFAGVQEHHGELPGERDGAQRGA